MAEIVEQQLHSIGDPGCALIFSVVWVEFAPSPCDPLDLLGCSNFLPRFKDVLVEWVIGRYKSPQSYR